MEETESQQNFAHATTALLSHDRIAKIWYMKN